MTEARIVDILGTSVALRAPDRFDADLSRLLDDLPAGHAPARRLALEPDDDGTSTLVDEGAVVLRGVVDAVAVATLVWRLNAIAAEADGHLIVHAGCVADEAGGVLLPGPSGTGKSWLTAACIVDGFDYFSDEHAALDLASGLLVPLAKPLDLGPRGLTSPSQLRLRSVGAPQPPSRIIFPEHRSGHDLSLARLDPAATLLGLCANCPSLTVHGAVGFRWLAGLAMACPAWRLVYDDGRAAVDAIRGTGRGLDERALPAHPVENAPSIRPATVTVVLDDDVVVFDAHRGRLHRLNRSAGLVWLCAADATDRRTLQALVLTEAPPGTMDPPDVVAAIEQLDSVGLLAFAEPQP